MSWPLDFSYRVHDPAEPLLSLGPLDMCVCAMADGLSLAPCDVAEQALLIAKLKQQNEHQNRFIRVRRTARRRRQRACRLGWLTRPGPLLPLLLVQRLFQALTLVLLLAMVYLMSMLLFLPWRLEHQQRFKASVSRSGFFFSYVLTIAAIVTAITVFRVSEARVDP
jgi:hypothetical protein